MLRARPCTSPDGASGERAWARGPRNARGALWTARSPWNDRVPITVAIGRRVPGMGGSAAHSLPAERGVTSAPARSPAPRSCRRRSRHAHTAGSPAPVLALVDPLDLPHEALPQGVLEVEDLVERPVEVIGDVRDLAVEAVGRVRHDSPRRPPATSTENSCLHAGQVTAARVWPSWLTRRYRSCRKATSEANMFSRMPAWTSSRVPRRVTTLPRMTMVR